MLKTAIKIWKLVKVLQFNMSYYSDVTNISTIGGLEIA